MTKKEVCALLGISPRTLERRMQSGRYKFTKGLGQYGEVSFTHADIGVSEPAPREAEPAPPICIPDLREPDAFAPQQSDFADSYKRGDATDSMGNTINGGNDRWPSKGAVTLLGPIEPMPKVLPDTTSHMAPGTVGIAGNERVENPVDSDEFMELIHPGFAERKAQMYAQCGVRPLSQQQQKAYNDRLALHAAFRWAR
jgi:hypothetical protein